KPSSPAERAAIDRWNKDMRELQKPAAPVATPAPPPAPVPAQAPPPVTAPAAATLAPLRPAPAPIQLTQKTPAPVDDANAGLRHVGVGALIVGGALAAVGGVFAATSWSKYNGAKNGACLATSEGCSKAADTIEQR